jgi:hypothetical protein
LHYGIDGCKGNSKYSLIKIPIRPWTLEPVDENICAVNYARVPSALLVLTRGGNASCAGMLTIEIRTWNPLRPAGRISKERRSLLKTLSAAEGAGVRRVNFGVKHKMRRAH